MTAGYETETAEDRLHGHFQDLIAQFENPGVWRTGPVTCEDRVRARFDWFACRSAVVASEALPLWLAGPLVAVWSRMVRAAAAACRRSDAPERGVGR